MSLPFNLFLFFDTYTATEAINRRLAAPTATKFLLDESDLMMIVVMMGFVSDGAAEGAELGSFDGLILGTVVGNNDGFVLGCVLGVDDGLELGEVVGNIDVEGVDDGLVDGEELSVGCADGWLLGEVDMVGLRDGSLDG